MALRFQTCPLDSSSQPQILSSFDIAWAPAYARLCRMSRRGPGDCHSMTTHSFLFSHSLIAPFIFLLIHLIFNQLNTLSASPVGGSAGRTTREIQGESLSLAPQFSEDLAQPLREVSFLASDSAHEVQRGSSLLEVPAWMWHSRCRFLSITERRTFPHL